ncbi:MAG: hypothetical protein M0Q46_05565 [Endomicrobiales bacterium]|nr:hypothetical protein [Endomicrobiales bacterium]
MLVETVEKKSIKGLKPVEIANKAIEKMNRKLIDEVFLIIQNDRELISNYLYAVGGNKLGEVNMAIARQIGRAYGLKGVEKKRNDKPSCTLIKSHAILKFNIE